MIIMMVILVILMNMTVEIMKVIYHNKYIIQKRAKPQVYRGYTDGLTRKTKKGVVFILHFYHLIWLT